MCVYVLLREEVSVRTAVLQGHAVAPGAHAVPRHGQRAVIVCQGGVLHHRHVPQEGIGLTLYLDIWKGHTQTVWKSLISWSFPVVCVYEGQRLTHKLHSQQ